MQDEEVAAFFTTADVARAAGVTPEAVRVWNRLGRLSAQRTVGGMRLYHRDDVERVLAERTSRRAVRGGGRPMR